MMSSPETRRYRREIACVSLAEYDSWVAAGTGEPLPAEVTGSLASCARWLLEALAEPH